MADTDVTPSGYDRSMHSIVLRVHGRSNGDELFACEENEIIEFVFWKPS